MSTVYKKADRGEYRSKLPYGKPRSLERQAHQDDRDRLEAQFKADLFAEYDVAQNPKAELCFRKAWEAGHASGYVEVVNCFDDLVELIK